MTEEINFDIWC